MQLQVSKTPIKKTKVQKTKTVNSAKTKNTVVNPWLDAKRSWRDRYSQIASSQLWYLIIAIVSTIVMLASMAVSIEAANRSQYVPYIVTVDDHGVAITSGIAKQITKTDDQVVAATLSQFIVDARSVTVDITYIKTAVERLYAHLKEQSQALAFINEYFVSDKGKNNPVVRAQEELVSVQINSILKQGKQTYVIEWTETTRARNGEKIKPDMSMKALISYEFGAKAKSDDIKGIINNPLGLYINQISWGRKSL